MAVDWLRYSSIVIMARLTDEQKADIYTCANMSEYQQKIKKEVGRGSYAPILVPNCSKIAIKIGCSSTTVDYLLNPSTRAKQQAYHQEYNKKYYKKYRKTKEGKAILKRAHKKYRLRHYLCLNGFKALGSLEKLIENQPASS